MCYIQNIVSQTIIIIIIAEDVIRWTFARKSGISARLYFIYRHPCPKE